MENLTDIELRAFENLIIGKKEISFANELKKMAKEELKKAEKRELLMQSQLSIANIKEHIAEQNRKLVNHKTKSKHLIGALEVTLKHDQEFTTFHEKLARIQKEIAKIHKEIAQHERKLAESRIDLAKEKLDLGKKRLGISKKQLKFIKAVKALKKEEKYKYIESQYKNEQKELNDAKNDILEVEKDIRKKANNLADLRGKLALKLAESEKIQYFVSSDSE
jgi:hypothetical protein